VRLGLEVEGEGQAPGTCCGVLSTTTHPQTLLEVLSLTGEKQALLKCVIVCLVGSCKFESLLGQRVPNSIGGALGSEDQKQAIEDSGCLTTFSLACARYEGHQHLNDPLEPLSQCLQPGRDQTKVRG
jgi:hypothetical protein